VPAARARKADGLAPVLAPCKTQRQIEAENGGAGIFDFDMRQHWDLDDADWRADVVPENFNGKNVAHISIPISRSGQADPFFVYLLILFDVFFCRSFVHDSICLLFS
jgi:hypothetical protein